MTDSILKKNKAQGDYITVSETAQSISGYDQMFS